MEINYNHLSGTLTPSEKLAQLKILNELNVNLKLILIQEVQSGNNISRVTKGWPEGDSVCVSLQKPFNKIYEHPDLQYQVIDDAHYGRAQYVSKYHPTHVLMC